MKHDSHTVVFATKTIAQLEAMTKGLDREFVIDTFRPLNPAERARWNRIKRKPGRPKIGKGAEVVSVSIERGPLGRADKLAKKLKLSRARLVAVGLEQLLASSEARPRPLAPKPQPRRAAAQAAPSARARRKAA